MNWRERGLPCFLIGGDSADYLRENPEVLAALHNGLTPDQNHALAASADIGMAAEKVVAQLGALFDAAPEAASAEPAHPLFVELATRIATQQLHYRSGDEETAAASISSLFKTTRELMTKHPKARAFHRVALALLNETVRPYTARWHGWMTQDGDKVDREGKPILKLRDEWVRRNSVRSCASCSLGLQNSKGLSRRSARDGGSIRRGCGGAQRLGGSGARRGFAAATPRAGQTLPGEGKRAR